MAWKQLFHTFVTSIDISHFTNKSNWIDSTCEILFNEIKISFWNYKVSIASKCK